MIASSSQRLDALHVQLHELPVEGVGRGRDTAYDDGLTGLVAVLMSELSELTR